MTRSRLFFSSFSWLFGILLFAAGCERTDTSGQAQQAPAAAAPAPRAAPDPAAAEKALHRLFDEYWETQMELNPVYATYVGDNRFNDRFENSIGPEWIRRNEQVAREFLDRIRKIDPELLSGQDRLSYDVFVFDREVEIEGFRFPDHLIPVSQFFSTPNFFATMGSGKGIHPFRTVKDYEDWLSRIDDFVAWMDQAIVNMREGIKRGIVQPRILMEKTLPQLAAHVKEKPEETVFWGPIENFPETFSEADRGRLTQAFREAITGKLVPAYRRLHDFIAEEYMQHARETVGMNALPDGEAWYAYLVRRTTTTDMTPQEIHEIGLAEVKRIHDEMRAVMEQVGFKGDLQAFFRHMSEDRKFYFKSREEMLEAYRALKPRVAELAPRLFGTIPGADFEIRPVEEFREQSASAASYLGASPDGSRPGVFYVNTYDPASRPKWAVESLFLHEAVPGHHFQGALTLELEELPKFRRFGGYTAYGEGWGLYAESLGKELGVYTDPYQYFGALEAELWRAIRLVVDTGLHLHGWTRQQVLDYMYANSSVKETRAVAEAERFMAIPSQALAYKVGQLKIRALRNKAEAALGERFDVREFHSQVLLDGELPLEALEKKIDRWIKSKAG